MTMFVVLIILLSVLQSVIPQEDIENHSNLYPEKLEHFDERNGQSPAVKLSAYESYKDLFQLGSSNFSKNVFGKKDSWIVVFHEDGTFTTGWKTMAASLRGIVWVGVVNIKDEHAVFSNQNLNMKEIPPALVYPYGNKKIKTSSVEAASSPLEAKNKAVKSIPNPYESISGDTIQPFLMDCFTTGVSRFPVILVNSDTLPTALFRAVALRFQKYFNFGMMINPSPNDLHVLGLQNVYFDFPSFFVMVTTDPINPQLNAIIYNDEEMGQMNYPNLVRFLFYVNNEYRYLLPGENRSNEEEVAKMTDILKIEEERFDFVNGSSEPSPKSKGSRIDHSKLKAEL